MAARRAVAICLFLALLPAAGWAASRAERDALGREVTLPAPPRRIVSLAPEVTEMLFALGLGPRVVGVTQYCNYPPSAKRLPKIGGFTNPSLERVLALRPDLAVGSRGNPRQVYQGLDRAHVPNFAVNPDTVDSSLAAIAQVGRLTDRTKEAGKLVASLKARLAMVGKEVMRQKRRPRILIVYSLSPLWVAGDKTFPDDILHRAGAANAVAGKESYLQLGIEAAVASRPDAILAIPMVGQTEADAVCKLRATPGLASLPCVKAGRVYSINADIVNRAGPRVVEAVERVHRIVARLMK